MTSLLFKHALVGIKKEAGKEKKTVEDKMVALGEHQDQPKEEKKNGLLRTRTTVVVKKKGKMKSSTSLKQDGEQQECSTAPPSRKTPIQPNGEKQSAEKEQARERQLSLETTVSITSTPTEQPIKFSKRLATKNLRPRIRALTPTEPKQETVKNGEGDHRGTGKLRPRQSTPPTEQRQRRGSDDHVTVATKKERRRVRASSPSPIESKQETVKIGEDNHRRTGNLRVRDLTATEQKQQLKSEDQQVEIKRSRTRVRASTPKVEEPQQRIKSDDRVDKPEEHPPLPRYASPKPSLPRHASPKPPLPRHASPKPPLPRHASPTKTPRQQPALDGSMCISPFFTKAYVFSNHFKCFFYVDKKRFCCSEQFYMYYKARVFGDSQSAREIMDSLEARDMKRLGSRIRLFNTAKWRRVSILVMTIGNMAKFAQNAELRRYLFETGNSVLVEASPDDIYWGVGVSVDSASIRDVKNWPGKNVLGRILTRVRDVLKVKFPDEWEAVESSLRRRTI